MSSRTKKTLSVSAALVAVAAIGAGGGAATYAALSPGDGTTVVRQVTVAGSQPAASSSESLSVSEIYDRSYKSVVEISVSSTSSDGPLGEPQTQSALGSGFVYDDQGHIVTNAHVVDGAQSVSVRFWDGSTHDATVVGTDPSTDLAVIKVDAPSSLLAPLALGDSDAVTVGEPVVAIGSPFGLEETVTSGIVSALHRQMSSPERLHDRRRDPDRRRHQPRQLGRAAPRLAGQGHRRELADRERVRRERRRRVRHPGEHGPVDRLPAPRHGQRRARLPRRRRRDDPGLGPVAARPPAGRRDHRRARAGRRPRTQGSAPRRAPRRSTGRTSRRAATSSPPSTARRSPTATDLQSAVDAKKPGDTITVTYSRDGQSRTVEVTLGTRPS